MAGFCHKSKVKQNDEKLLQDLKSTEIELLYKLKYYRILDHCCTNTVLWQNNKLFEASKCIQWPIRTDDMTWYLKGGHHYIDISDDDALPVGVQEIVAFGISTDDFGDSPLHLREAGEDMFCVHRVE